jgi:hypothetical protein
MRAAVESVYASASNRACRALHGRMTRRLSTISRVAGISNITGNGAVASMASIDFIGQRHARAKHSCEEDRLGEGTTDAWPVAGGIPQDDESFMKG